jgi:uncharacterized protein YndB with AHSA1/START domain
MLDIVNHLDAVRRHVETREAGGGELVAVVMRRRYPAPPEDVWEALTDPDRLRRWFLPISGDLKEGGTFQLEGNAGGEIRSCEPPKRLLVTYGSEISLVQVTLTADGDDGTLFELDHTVPIEMAGSTAGALWVGPGWDGAVAALGLFLTGVEADDPTAAASSAEGQELTRLSTHLWVDVVTASGGATAEQIATARDQALQQFAPDHPDTPPADAG